MKPLLLLRVTTLPFETLAPLRAERAVAIIRKLLSSERSLEAEAASLSDALHAAAGDRIEDADAEKARGRLALVALRRDVHNGRPLPPEKLEQAAPWLEQDLLAALRKHAAAREEQAALLSSHGRAYRADLAAARSALLRLSRTDLFEEGIRLASRALLPRLRELGDRDPSSWGHGERHVAAKAAAYLARFCTKTSPNGVFCATGLADAGDGPARIGGEPRIDRLDVLLNIHEAAKVAACLAASPEMEPAVAPRANPTLRESGGAWTYWKLASSRNETDAEVLSRVKDNPVLRLFIEEAERPARGVLDLLGAVAERCEVDPADLEIFYRGLVERGILVAEVEIPYNARRPLREIATAARRAGCAATWLAAVEEIETAVDSLPALSSAERIAAMDGIGAALEALPHNRPLQHDEIFRVDAASALEVRLPARMIEDLQATMRFYARLFAAMYPGTAYEGTYVARFLELHPADTEVNLLELYRGFVEHEDETRRPAAFPEPAEVEAGGARFESGRRAMHEIRDHFARLAGSTPPGAEIRIDETELRSLIGERPEPRWSCGVLFQIAARAARDLDEGRYRPVISALFPGAGLSLSRFAHLHGGGRPPEQNPVVRELRRAWSCVEREGAVVAEVTYNHHARTANAGLRPSIFHYEIEMPGERASPGAEVIPLRDLKVRYDSGRRRFILRWVGRDVEVVPVISSGINPVGPTSFLVAVGQQGLQPVGYFPGFDMKGIARWPRVVCGRVVLFRARWVFRAGDWPRAAGPGGPVSDADYFLETSRWREKHALPRHVFVHTSREPKPRYVDLESPIFVDLLRRDVAALAADPAASLHVSEMLPGPEDLLISGGGGRYASEFVIQMERL